MEKTNLSNILVNRDLSLTLDYVLENSKAGSGGERDLNFLKFLVENKLLNISEASLKRSDSSIVEEYYLDRYKKMNLESDRHFLCRTVIQDELRKLGINTYSGLDVGNMDILRSNSNYDIVADDYSFIIDVGLTPARNYFRGLTDPRIKHYLHTSYFDEYMDDIIFSIFTKGDEISYLEAISEYREKYKEYVPQGSGENELLYNDDPLPL